MVGLIEPTSSSATRTGSKSITRKARPGPSGKRPSLDNLKTLISRKEDKTRKTVPSSGAPSNESRQGSTGTPGQPKRQHSGHGRQSKTGPLTEEQRQAMYDDDGLKLRLRMNGLVSGSDLGPQLRAGRPHQPTQPLNSRAKVTSRS